MNDRSFDPVRSDPGFVNAGPQWLLTVIFFHSYYVAFFICENEENMSDFIKRSETQNFTLHLFTERRATKHSYSVICCRKSHKLDALRITFIESNT